MAFNSIDGHGHRNRHQRRIVSAIQRSEGKDVRKDAAKAKRQRKQDRLVEQALARIIHFYNQPVHLNDPDGAYISDEIDGKRQIIVAGALKASVDHYVKATSAFLKKPMRLISEKPMEIAGGSGRPFLVLVMELG